jgi:tRNA uridine 5-carbamoylmethylation protein Kti12
MKLILFRGRPGTGKTLMSNLLSAKINAPIIRKDDIYDAISELEPDHQLRNRATFKFLYTILSTNKHINSKIIVDCPFQFPDDLSQLRKWCFENDVELTSILVTCSDESIWAARFNKRADNPSPNQLITDFKKLKERYTEMQLEAEADELLIDTVKSPEENIAKILQFLN